MNLQEISDIGLKIVAVASIIAPWLPVPNSQGILATLRKILIDLPAMNFGWARNEHPQKIRAEKLAKKQRKIGGKPGRR